MRTCREHKGNIDSEPLVVGSWALCEALGHRESWGPGRGRGRGPRRPRSGLSGDRCTASRGSPVVLGARARRPVLTPSGSRGRRESFFRTHLGGEVSPQPLVGRPRGFWTRPRLGPQCPMECRNRLESQQSETRALETSGSRRPVGRGSPVVSA